MPLCARDVMQTDVLTVRPDMPLAELGDFLISERISGVPVVDGDTLVGIVSRSDIVRAFSLERSLAGLAAEGVEQVEFAPADEPDPLALLKTSSVDFSKRTVRDVMVADTVTVTPETPIREVARVLVGRHLHRVLVTEGTRVRGVISALDLVRLVGDGRVRES